MSISDKTSIRNYSEVYLVYTALHNQRAEEILRPLHLDRQCLIYSMADVHSDYGSNQIILSGFGKEEALRASELFEAYESNEDYLELKVEVSTYKVGKGNIRECSKEEQNIAGELSKEAKKESGGGAGGKTGLYLCDTKKPEEWMECLKENGEEECGAKNYAGFLSYKKEPDMTRIARCIVANYNSGITRFGESSGVMYCKACDEKCTQKCVEARAALTPDRLNKRQNGRRFKEDGEPEFTLTTIDRHGVMMLQCPYYTGLPIKEATKKGYVMARHGDGINLSYPDSDYRRGRVGKQCSQTLLTGARMSEPNR